MEGEGTYSASSSSLTFSIFSLRSMIFVVDAKLAHVVTRLIEMLFEIGRATVEPADVFQQHAHLFLDQAGLLAHAHVLQYGAPVLGVTPTWSARR